MRVDVAVGVFPRVLKGHRSSIIADTHTLVPSIGQFNLKNKTQNIVAYKEPNLYQLIEIRVCADMSLTQQVRKPATANNLRIYVTYSLRSSIHV